jgi:nitroreductase
MISWTMPDALELLTTRRSFKAVELAGPPPSATEIDTLLTVASRVPDHGKLAPWRFIVFEGEAVGRRGHRRCISRQIPERAA